MPLQVVEHSTYKRHRPEQTLMYQLVEQHYPEFLEQLSVYGVQNSAEANIVVL